MMAPSQTTVNDPSKNTSDQPVAPNSEDEDALLSDEPTIELVVRAQRGDRLAVEALLQRSIPQPQAMGPWPAAGRGAGQP